jgi:glycogen operon protein
MDATALLVMNAHHDVVNFRLPEVVGGNVWRCLVDTNAPEIEGQKRFRSGDEYTVTGRSFLLLVLEPETEHSIGLRRALEAFRHMAEQPIPVANPETEIAAALESERAPA